MGLHIVHQDITKMSVDIIVNAANNGLVQGGGVCGAIFRAAGSEKLEQACSAIGSCETGQAVSTPAFALDAQYIIHTVGPIWRNGEANEKELLISCYENSLALALSLNCKSIAFPLISSGIYGYPKRQALEVARNTIEAFLQKHEIDVYLTVYDRESVEIGEQLFINIKKYLELHEEVVQLKRTFAEQNYLEATVVESKTEHLIPLAEEFEKIALAESFQQKLFRFIDERGYTDPEVYKRANISRKHFSKIRNTPNYQPTKKTVVALAIALHLNLDDTDELLEAAGFALSSSQRFDLIIRYFIEREIYNIFEINEVLFTFEQPLLGQL